MIGPVVLLAAGWAATWTVTPFSDTRITDVFVYLHDAGLLAAGATPYTSAFPFEYPPLALVPIGLPHALGGDYEVVLGALMAACSLGVLIGVHALGGRTAAWAFALAPLAAGAVLRTHFDLLVAALLVAAFVAFARQRTTTAFALLGAATMTKGFPLFAAIPALAWCWAQRSRREALVGLGVYAAVVAAVSAPFLGNGYLDAYRFHVDRPVQVESTPAVVLYAVGGAHVTGTTTTPDEFNSNGLRGGPAGAVQAVFGVLFALTLALLAWLATRRSEPEPMLVCAIAAVVAFAALGKVLSPQYVAWLAPGAALLLAWRARVAAALLGLAVVLTQVEFPARYADLVRGETGVRAIVAARDLVLVAALIATGAAAARWPRPAAAPART